MKKTLSVIISLLLIMAFSTISLGLVSVPIKSIKLVSNDITVKVGKTCALKVEFTPTNTTNRILAYSSKDNKIATVDKNGIVKGIKTGNTEITVTSSTNKKAVAKCKVSVLQGTTVIKVLNVTWGDALPENQGSKRIHDAILKKLDIDVKLTLIRKPDDFAAKVNLAIASGEKYDVMNLPSDDNYHLYDQLIQQDYIIPIDNLLANYGKDILASARPEALEYLKRNGKMYAWANESETCNQCIEIRQDLLDKYGLKYPTTISEYENAVKTIQAKEKGMSGITMYWDNLDDIFVQAYVKTGSDDWLDTKDNKIKPYYLAPGFKNYLTAMARFYRKGILPKDYLTMKSDEVNNLVNAGKTVMFTSFGAANAPWYDTVITKVDPNGKFVVLKPLKGTENAGFSKGMGVGDPFVITKSCKVPQKAMEFANYVAGTIEGYALTAWGQDGIDYFSKSVSSDRIVIDSSKAVTLRGSDLYSNIYRTGLFLKMRHAVSEDGVVRWYQMMSEVKLHTGITYGMPGDTSKYKSKNVMADLLDLYKQEKNKVIMGQTSVADWDANFVKKWMDMGGDQYIEDRTLAYNEFKNKK